ncbi:hypothetical protein F7725_008743 [Dissostichus mawsoni]|uniref:Uncharacterized protein n=1 Tax=Dissostichus mawsoni TaxID=36200 RepID=A0A7J5Y878_DISMA|nr:hypothetical protein F7725_008743 [Dissostichus mawsoni]
METPETEHDQEEDIIQAVQASRSDSEVGSPISLEKEVVSEDIQEAETVIEEPRDETITLLTVTSEPVEASKTGDIQEPEEVQAVKEATSDSDMGSIPSIEKQVGSPQSFVKEVISEDIPVVETDKDEPKQDDEVEPEERLPEEAAITEHVQEPEVLPSDSEAIVTEIKADEGTSMDVKEVLEDIEGVTNGIESEVVAQLDTSLETAEDQETGIIPQDVVENCVPEVVDELQTLTAVSVSLVIEETVLTEQPPALCEDTAKVTNEPNHEVQLGAVQATVETEKECELPGTETKNAFEHAVVAQVVVCKDASVAIPDVMVQNEQLSLNPRSVKWQMSKCSRMNEADEKVEGGSVVVMMHVPSVESEDNHRIQVQVVDVDVKSAETIRDSMLEVGVTEVKEVIDVCHETVTKVEDLSATLEIEEELTNEELKVTIEEVVPHVKENLPEPESVVEQEGVNPPEAVKEVVQGEVEAPKAMEDNSETFRERQEEAPTVVSDVSAPEQVSKDLVPNQPEFRYLHH